MFPHRYGSALYLSCLTYVDNQVVPIYGRGGDNTDPRSRISATETADGKEADDLVPARPAGQRAVPVQVCPSSNHYSLELPNQMSTLVDTD